MLEPSSTLMTPCFAHKAISQNSRDPFPGLVQLAWPTGTRFCAVSFAEPTLTLSSVFSIVNSWLTYASSFGIALTYGGGQTAVFGLLMASVVQWVVLLGLAELCSALPSSGVGSKSACHFILMLTPPRLAGRIPFHIYSCA